MAHGIKDNQIQEIGEDEADYALPSPNSFWGSHINLIPLQSAVQGPRLFYGARFYNQALPLSNPEAPLVQNLVDGDPEGRSFDELLGAHAGAVRAPGDAEVVDVTPDAIHLKTAEGKHRVDLYNNFAFNRKSVTGSSVILIRRAGIIWRGPIRAYCWQQGDEVWSICRQTFESAWHEVTGYLRHRNDKQLFRVLYDSGRSVVVTEDHSLITLGDDGDLVPVLPTDIRPGTTRSPVVLFPQDAETESLKKTTMYKWGLLAGLYLAEGSLSRSRQYYVDIAVKPADRIAEVRALLRDIAPHAEIHDTSSDVSFSDFAITEWLYALFGSGAGQKYVSAQVFNYPAKFRAGLIAGYLAGDGCLWSDSNDAVQLVGVTTSGELRDGLVDVLASLGVFCTLFDAPRRRINDSWKDAYGFRVGSSNLNKLDRWFFYSDREQQLRKLKSATYRASPFEQVPIPACLKKKLYQGLRGKDLRAAYAAGHKGYISKWRVCERADVFGRLGRASTLWDTIVDVRPVPSEDWVYDLEVRDAEMFAVNNGLIVHNTAIHNTPSVKKGDRVKAGQLLARSNYTDDRGTLAMGLNAKVGLVPFKGWSMDDAVVVSEGFAKRLTSEHTYTTHQDFDRDTRGGMHHFISLFPTAYTQEQLKNLDEDGAVKPGTVVRHGDPLVLATRPKVISSGSAQLGKLSRSMRQARSDASQVWEHEDTGIVTDTAKTKNGIKVIVQSLAPTRKGDKIVFRSGQKGVISKIIPDEQMPRTVAGEPLEVLLNPLGIPSRANNSIIYELLLGKVASCTGQTIKLPGFNKPGEKWYDLVKAKLDEAGLPETEEVFDPTTNRKLERPITTGSAYVLKLHHTSESKASARGQAGYDSEQQPLKGGGEGAQAKRLSGLETHSLLSAGAYKTLREGSTLRGARNDEYWRTLRSGYRPRPPGTPFVWDKFQALLQGAGLHARNIGDGRLRLGPFTDQDLEDRKPVDIQNGEMVNLNTLEPIPGGLFDSGLVGGNKWGRIALPFRVPNPGFEPAIRALLGLTQKELREIMAGRMELPEHIR